MILAQSPPTINRDLEAAVSEWTPRDGVRPAVDLEPRADGLRVKLTYLGVESGVLFPRGETVSTDEVRSVLDRVYDVLSWRVTAPPA